MNLLDWLLLVLIAAYALSGYWQGFVTGAFATVGLLTGGLFGIWLAPTVLRGANPSLAVSLGALFIVILCASLGQALLQYVGAKVRDKITWRPARVLDALGGAVLSALAVLLVAWALGVAISGTRIGPITSMVRNSYVLSKVNTALPQAAPRALQAFNNVVGTGFFPRYLEPFAPEQIVNVPPGPKNLPSDPGVAATRVSVVKIRGANSCGRGVEGSGFVYAPDRVMTNAHVVGGVNEPTVQIGGIGQLYDATVVRYDWQRDIA
ncbi:MAG: MarP family serine protease, partial [Micrococcales bacterium]|nr:MarP family serine protease [Micrococcales bacterium]